MVCKISEIGNNNSEKIKNKPGSCFIKDNFKTINNTLTYEVTTMTGEESLYSISKELIGRNNKVPNCDKTPLRNLILNNSKQNSLDKIKPEDILKIIPGGKNKYEFYINETGYKVNIAKGTFEAIKNPIENGENYLPSSPEFYAAMEQNNTYKSSEATPTEKEKKNKEMEGMLKVINSKLGVNKQLKLIIKPNEYEPINTYYLEFKDKNGNKEQLLIPNKYTSNFDIYEKELGQLLIDAINSKENIKFNVTKLHRGLEMGKIRKDFSDVLNNIYIKKSGETGNLGYAEEQHDKYQKIIGETYVNRDGKKIKDKGILGYYEDIFRFILTIKGEEFKDHINVDVEKINRIKKREERVLEMYNKMENDAFIVKYPAG